MSSIDDIEKLGSADTLFFEKMTELQKIVKNISKPDMDLKMTSIERYMSQLLIGTRVYRSNT